MWDCINYSIVNYILYSISPHTDRAYPIASVKKANNNNNNDNDNDNDNDNTNNTRYYYY